MKNTLTLILMITLLSVSSPTPLQRDFTCPEAKKEIIFFKTLISNTTSSTFLPTLLNYFNKSSAYVEPLQTYLIKTLKCNFATDTVTARN